jgi:hypothetical protein
MPKVAIPKKDLDNSPDWSGGSFPVVPEGVGVLFEIVPNKDGGQTGKFGQFESKDGSMHDYLVVDCECIEGVGADAEGKGITHSEFFDLSDEDNLGKFRNFLERVGAYDGYHEEWDTEELRGIQFVSDVKHYVDKKNQTKSSLVYKTIGIEGGAAEPPKSKKGGRAPAAPRRAARARGGSAR